MLLLLRGKSAVAFLVNYSSMYSIYLFLYIADRISTCELFKKKFFGRKTNVRVSYEGGISLEAIIGRM